MQITHQDFKKGKIKLKVTSLEDLWYLSQLVDPGDLVRGPTTRKIKIGEGENLKTVKKNMTLTLEAEEVELTETLLRVHGKVQEGPDEVPRGAYHTLSFEEGDEFSLQKVEWLSYQKQKLQEAAEQRYNYLLCLLDREQALIALTKQKGFEVLVKLEGEVLKKGGYKQAPLRRDFGQEISKALEIYAGRYEPERIIIASPAFYKEELLKRISGPELRRKIVLASCSDVSERSLGEVLLQPELAQALRSSRIREEQLAVEELLKEIKKDNLAVYGWKEVQRAAEAGAIHAVLLTDTFIRQRRLGKAYGEVDELLKTVDRLQGEIQIISTDHEAGRKLQGLGGIAAVLRYKLRYKLSG